MDTKKEARGMKFEYIALVDALKSNLNNCVPQKEKSR